MHQGVVTNLVQSVWQEVVIRVKPHEPIASGPAETLVDGIRLTRVGFGSPKDGVCFSQNFDRVIPRTGIEDKMLDFDAFASLCVNAGEAVPDEAGLIQAWCDN